MRHKVWKAFWFWQHEKEEAWLNNMSSKGMRLVYAGFMNYTFEDAPRGEYLYRTQLLGTFFNSAEDAAYIRFLEETGIEHICTFGRWGYFRRKASEGPFEIYSDNASKIKHYKRIIQFIIMVGSGNTFMIPSSIQRVMDNRLTDMYIIILAIQVLITALLVIGVTILFKKIRKLKKDSNIIE